MGLPAFTIKIKKLRLYWESFGQLAFLLIEKVDDLIMKIEYVSGCQIATFLFSMTILKSKTTCLVTSMHMYIVFLSCSLHRVIGMQVVPLQSGGEAESNTRIQKSVKKSATCILWWWELGTWLGLNQNKRAECKEMLPTLAQLSILAYYQFFSLPFDRQLIKRKKK